MVALHVWMMITKKKKKRLWSVHPFVFVFVLSLLQCRTHTEHCPCKPKSWNETGMEQSCLRLLSSLPFYNLLIKQTSQKHHHPSTHFCQRTDIVLLHAIVTTTDPSSNTYTGINTVGHNVTAQTSAHLQRHCTDISLPSTCTSSTSRQLTVATTIKFGMVSMSLLRQYLLDCLTRCAEKTPKPQKIITIWIATRYIYNNTVPLHLVPPANRITLLVFTHTHTHTHTHTRTHTHTHTPTHTHTHTHTHT